MKDEQRKELEILGLTPNGVDHLYERYKQWKVAVEKRDREAKRVYDKFINPKDGRGN